MHILFLLVTDNNPSWISRRSLTVENISWSISTKELCVPWYPQGRQFGWGLKSGTCIGQNYTFFWLSINYASNFPILLSLSYAASPPRYSSQVWRQRVWWFWKKGTGPELILPNNINERTSHFLAPKWSQMVRVVGSCLDHFTFFK